METEFTFKKGDRVLMVLRDGHFYEGDVQVYSENAQRVSLINIIQNPGNIVIDGIRHFEGNEISHVKILTSATDTSDGASSNIESKDGPTGMKISDEEHKKIKDLQNSYRYICNTCSDYYSAISLLQKSEIIGICIKDGVRGRGERASLITVATETNILIFDIKTLGDKIFDMALRDVLQSENIIKVVYDCRLLSDCLYHRHQTYLANVRDVEAEDVINVYQERGCIRTHTRSFGYLIETYLGIPREIVQENSEFGCWKSRPLSISQQDFLATYASFLIPLHKAIEKNYLQRLVNASKLYNEFYRDSDPYTCITHGIKYVLRDKFIELVKHKTRCRGTEQKLS